MSFYSYYLRVLIILTFIGLVLSLLPLVRDPRYLPGPAPKTGQYLSQVPVIAQRPSVAGYEREKFGGWASQGEAGCTTRTVVLYGECGHTTLLHNQDPYSGRKLNSESQFEIDHIYPLRAAWDMGAHRWNQEKREAFANDPVNLVAVSRSENQSKSDALPSDWVPKQRASRCWYVRRLVVVAWKYRLPLSTDDVAVIKRECWLRELLS
ncbi:MAG: HNH endonuclease family protein [Corynebacterium sp.]|nr:HNH endonuclease family protein [Corynebacterium sp.]